MKHRRVTVSDHAVLRYLERVQGVDLNAVRDEIAAKVDPALTYDGLGGVTSGGFTFKLSGLTVTTVIKQHHPDPRTKGGRS